MDHFSVVRADRKAQRCIIPFMISSRKMTNTVISGPLSCNRNSACKPRCRISSMIPTMRWMRCRRSVASAKPPCRGCGSFWCANIPPDFPGTGKPPTTRSPAPRQTPKRAPKRAPKRPAPGRWRISSPFGMWWPNFCRSPVDSIRTTPMATTGCCSKASCAGNGSSMPAKAFPNFSRHQRCSSPNRGTTATRPATAST